eukprot:1314864-Amphidinium_carterae.1
MLPLSAKVDTDPARVHSLCYLLGDHSLFSQDSTQVCGLDSPYTSNTPSRDNLDPPPEVAYDNTKFFGKSSASWSFGKQHQRSTSTAQSLHACVCFLRTVPDSGSLMPRYHPFNAYLKGDRKSRSK